MLRGLLQITGLLNRLPLGGEPARTLRTADYHWHILSHAEELFDSAGPNLTVWTNEGRVETIKTGSQRTVYRVHLPGGTVVVKCCRVNGPRAWWREVFRGSKSRLEFEHALALQQQGIPAVEPLAWGTKECRGPCESMFVTRYRENTTPLVEYLEQLGNRSQRVITAGLGRLLAQMHDAGVAHPDPHPGNFLLGWDGPTPLFSLIDLHAIQFGQPLNWQASLDNLVLLNRWFQLRATRMDRLAFWQAYVKHRTTLPTACPVALANLAKEVELRTEQSNARFWNNRLARYLKSNRQYQRISRGSVSGHAVRELPTAYLERLLADPDAPFRNPDAKILKDSRSSTVIEVHIPTAKGVTIGILKRFRIKSKLVPVKNLLRSSPALRSWTFGHNLLDRGLPTARPLAVLHRHKFGCQTEGYLLTERVPNAVELSQAMADLAQLPTAERTRIVRAWTESLGRLIRLMHDRQVNHRDLKAPNILMSQMHRDPANATPVLIDLVGVTPGQVVSRANRMRNLARLNASFVHRPTITRTDRLRFLRAYMAWGLHGSKDWKDWWHGIERETRAKVAKNERSGRPLA